MRTTINHVHMYIIGFVSIEWGVGVESAPFGGFVISTVSACEFRQRGLRALDRVVWAARFAGDGLAS